MRRSSDSKQDLGKTPVADSSYDTVIIHLSGNYFANYLYRLARGRFFRGFRTIMPALHHITVVERRRGGGRERDLGSCFRGTLTSISIQALENLLPVQVPRNRGSPEVCRWRRNTVTREEEGVERGSSLFVRIINVTRHVSAAIERRRTRTVFG